MCVVKISRIGTEDDRAWRSSWWSSSHYMWSSFLQEDNLFSDAGMWCMRKENSCRLWCKNNEHKKVFLKVYLLLQLPLNIIWITIAPHVQYTNTQMGQLMQACTRCAMELNAICDIHEKAIPHGGDSSWCSTWVTEKQYQHSLVMFVLLWATSTTISYGIYIYFQLK